MVILRGNGHGAAPPAAGPAAGPGDGSPRPPRCRHPLGMVIAGGGTGGHLFPGIAIAEEFLARDPAHRILFIGTERGLEKTVLEGMGLPLRTIRIRGIKGRGPLQILAALAMIPGAFLAAFRILREFRPDLVVGVGGYASGPAVLTARLMGTKTAIAEQNAFPGLTNRLLGRVADRIFLTFPASQRWFSEGRTEVTGNPIRAAFFAGKPPEEKEDPRFTLLIFGGSQGARAINRAAAEALSGLAHLKDRLRFIHQTGNADLERVAAAYREGGFAADVSPFIRDMAAAYRKADLLVCRAGATSIAEITAGGKASILIPFPFAVNDHQRHNAEVLSRAGAAEVIAERDLNGPVLAGAIERLVGHPDRIGKMEAAAAALGRRQAARDIVDICLALAGQQEPAGGRRGRE
ncbi:MAG: undecaprenyldiphospho-muramoylpentapeptide beta-N-acetylglucosaminyltransferase [Thermodesulfobacteriota bacterium]